MKADRYSHVMLTIIALTLIGIFLRDIGVIPRVRPLAPGSVKVVSICGHNPYDGYYPLPINVENEPLSVNVDNDPLSVNVENDPLSVEIER